jgi:hypothetical protein
MSFSKASATMAAVFVLAGAGYASAAVVTYNESVSGDLPAGIAGNPLPIMNLDVGTNTVKGTSGVGGSVDFDSFAFTVPVGAQLVSANVAATDVAGSTRDITDLVWNLFKGSANFSGGTFVENILVDSPGTKTFSSTPLGSNTYNISASTIETTGSGSGFSDYTFTFVVQGPISAAPEVGTLTIWLTLFGLAVGAKTCRKLFPPTRYAS